MRGRTERDGAVLLKTFTKITLAIAVSWICTAAASGWDHSVSLAAGAEQDSNPSMAPAREGSVLRSRVAPRYSLSGNFGRDDYALSLALLAEQSSDEKLSNRRRDKSGSLAWGHTFETGSVLFNARGDEASTRATELEDSGLVSRESTRKSYAFQLNTQNSVSERTSVNVGASQDGAKYEDAALRNYANRTLEVGLGHAVSERLVTSARMATTKFEPAPPGTPSTTHSVSFGLSVHAQAGFDWTARYGYRHTVADTKSDGSDWLLSLHWKGETDDFLFAVSRQFNPSSVGSMSVLDSVKGTWQAQWGTKSRSSIDVSLTKRHGIFATEMAQTTAALIYDTSSASNIRLYVQEKRIDRANATATATVVGASLAYNWRP